MQRVLTDRDSTVRGLYWRVAPETDIATITHGGGLAIPNGATVEFGGYFNSLFEFQWRAYTRATDIALRVRLRGSAVLRLWRDNAASGLALLWEGVIGDGVSQIAVPVPGTNPRAAGRVFFELTARDDVTTVEDAEYVVHASAVEQVGLTLVFCTFNRERDISACLECIAGDAALVEALAAIIVVNQGRPGLSAPASLRGKLQFVEQANYGGAGGFTRGLLEALDTPRATHACFVDDDVRIEPESLYRMINFFRLARPDLALGGHMLDGIRANVLYEAGAVVDRANWQLRPLHPSRDLREPAVLRDLVDYTPMDYNGWWLFGFPLAFVRRVGLPLPCFIRGDDVEYGLRLNAAGLTTVGLPGVAVWHEPFYMKTGGWQLYYEVRNQLVAASLHFGFARRHVATVMLKHLLVHLLTFRYFSAALIVRGIADFLRGPDVLRRDPGSLHVEVTRIKQRYPEASVARTRVVPAAFIAPSARTKFGFQLAMARVLWRNFMRPTRPNAPAQLVDVGDLVWFRMEHAEHVVVDNHWELEMPEFVRSRAHFRAIAREALKALLGLWRDGERTALMWRDAAPALTSEAHWRTYLGLDDAGSVAPERAAAD